MRLAGLVGALMVVSTCSSSLGDPHMVAARNALAAEPRFQQVLLIRGPNRTVGLEGIVASERDAFDARSVVFQAVPAGTFSAVFIALLATEPGMSRLGVPWAAMPGSADDWKRLTGRDAQTQARYIMKMHERPMNPEEASR